MPLNIRFQEIPKYLARWLVLAPIAGVLAGLASAVLILSLEWATRTREAHLWIIALLPIAGLAVGLMYHYLGSAVEAGNNLILEEIYAEAEAVDSIIPARMTPLILIGTAATHLFGGSAGREGTALQTGASLADQLTWLLRRFPRLALDVPSRRILLMAGVAAGFGSVFGTPIAGALFALEVLTVTTPNHRTLNYAAVLPCFIASFVADFTTRACHIHHTLYAVTPDALRASTFAPTHVFAAIAAGIIFGLTALFFIRCTHATSRFFKRHVAYPPLRPFIGGTIVALAVIIPLRLHFDATRYIGLGIPTISAAFTRTLPHYDFAAKFAYTILTLGSSFKGGEVTPLFYIGSTLGNALSSLLPLPSSLLAAMGFVAVFAGAANTPFASALMAFELFGPRAAAFAAIACILSYICSGNLGMYRSQRPVLRKEAR